MTKRLNEIIDQIRREEREKIYKELEMKETGKNTWKEISSHMEDWGERHNKNPWQMGQIKNSIYTVIRYSLDVEHVTRLKEDQLGLALNLTNGILNMIHP